MNTGGTLSFDSATNTYSFYGGYGDWDQRDVASFDSASAMAAPANYEIRQKLYERDGGQSGSREELKLFIPGSANMQLALTYVNYGVKIVSSIDSLYQRREYFYYGVDTPSANLPTSGSATYSGIAEGTFTDGFVPYRLIGTSSLTADFGARTVAASLDLSGTTAVINAAPFSPRQFSGSGTISVGTVWPARQFSGTLTSSANPGYDGSFGGSFFGPNAAEYGFTFLISNGVPYGSPGGGVGVGVAVGK